MKLIQKFSFFSFFFLLIFSCKNQTHRNKHTNEDPNFLITKHAGYKTVFVFRPGHKKDTLARYVLYHRGSSKPKVGFKATFIQTPVSRMACLSSVYLGAIEMLGKTDKVVAVDHSNYIINEKIRKRIKTGEVLEIAVTGTIELEKTLVLKPDLILTFGSEQLNIKELEKLQQYGIPTVFCNEQFECSPINRAAWLKFIGALFEAEEKADTILAVNSEKYYEIKEFVAAHLEKNRSTRPTVITEIPYNGVWYVPGGKSFAATLLKDAGASYLWNEDTNTGSLPLNYETVFLKARTAEYWLNVHSWEKLKDCVTQDHRNEEFTAYKKRNIYNNTLQKNETGGNAYWEKGTFNPHLILEDLVRIFHPEILKSGNLNFYSRLH